MPPIELDASSFVDLFSCGDGVLQIDRHLVVVSINVIRPVSVAVGIVVTLKFDIDLVVVDDSLRVVMLIFLALRATARVALLVPAMVVHFLRLLVF